VYFAHVSYIRLDGPILPPDSFLADAAGLQQTAKSPFSTYDTSPSKGWSMSFLMAGPQRLMNLVFL